MTQLQHAQLHYNETGTPVSDLFDDVYFSNDNGLLETDYVFLQQNQLPDRWFAHPKDFFHIFETGFGTGLNFLLTWQRFREARAEGCGCKRLYFSSFEKYPLQKADLQQALTAWPALAELSAELIAAYPAAFPGPQRLWLDNGTVVLDLWLGDVNELLPQIPLQNKADAWYLDGFAPSKNPDMWQDSLFHGMFRLSQPGTTVSTFTSAGLVKRGLAAAGFAVQKIKGYGRKREMLVARHPESQVADQAQSQSALIIGAGLAGLCSAVMLHQAGWRVTVLCADSGPGESASQNRQGALYPNLHADYSLMSALSTQSFQFATQWYRRLQAELGFAVGWCGLLQLACTDELALRQQKIASRPSSLYQAVSATEASNIAGLRLPFSALYFPQAGWLCPQQICQTLTGWLQNQGVRFEFNCQVRSVTAGHAVSNQGDFSADQLILATGAQLTELWPSATLPQRKVRGQVSHLESEKMHGLKTVICHKGYITPADQGLHSVGATFDRQSPTPDLKDEDNQYNINLVNQVLSAPDWFSDVRVHSAKAGMRATVPDHLPLLGNHEGIWVLGALAARGLTWAPLLANSLNALLSDEPVALSLQQLKALRPDRFQPK
ncbi:MULTISPECIES: bifunctional tRNA (5-methylaminomethyl-2-thiouridine)(34)-methyltransferase MnmD/FAD-dependent 5-carboxymethylaminomethyl-2-thiouridine(34) oxidoreductase MnmC [Rheinheimera]|uniref:tRNA 5-methylaminomethyl-2-thiouridine biosynthesis bifunctional protein MnmC n=1 Tax=Rheinheimera marina TaxID=1774958 RepID=A0ABV9JP00_9GAMM